MLMIVARMRNYSNPTFYTKPAAAALQCCAAAGFIIHSMFRLGLGTEHPHVGAALISPCSWHTCGYRGNKEPECVSWRKMSQ